MTRAEENAWRQRYGLLPHRPGCEGPYCRCPLGVDAILGTPMMDALLAENPVQLPTYTDHAGFLRCSVCNHTLIMCEGHS